jgi:wyosine [tRNA(Phe)-imidazoG37] synthetase (radical SAM superfamily)
MVPEVDEMRLGQRLDLGEVHQHAVHRLTVRLNDVAGQCDFERVAVTMQVPALALMIGNAMACVELETLGDQHDIFCKGSCRKGRLRRIITIPPLEAAIPDMHQNQLATTDHSRDSADMTYVYPVVSRRAGGVSIGINLNPNNACNWHCVYCQVPNLTRGRAPAIDLDLLEQELRAFLEQVLHGDFLVERVPEGARHVEDVAFSGNGEPTSARDFPQALERVLRVLAETDLLGHIPLRLITNGSLLDKPVVQATIARLGENHGEVWFKVDAGTSDAIMRINDVALDPQGVVQRLRQCGALCSTWVQTCCFALDGFAPNEAELVAYLELLGRCRDRLAGVYLYGLARPSLQQGATRLARLPAYWLDALAHRVCGLGLPVRVNP